jgi:Zn ribbon nucleic-acid-binding protein
MTKTKSHNKISYAVCERCKKKVTTLYWNREEQKWLCEECQFRDRTKDPKPSPNEQKKV